VPNAELRDRARAIPTALVISREDRTVLATVARSSVETSTELARLRAAMAMTGR
jgi:hypothetical protein